MDKRARLMIASFLTLIAAGMGFAIRNNGILGEWGAEFSFTKERLGTITGGGLTGFGVTILICSLFADRIGYKTLMVLAFLLHVASAVITYLAVVFKSDQETAFNCLYWGAFVFALGNGVCESVINPLVAALYPKQKTHYLNILHAGWPGGLILGAILASCFVGSEAYITKLHWLIPMTFFLVPTLIYGIMVLFESFPKSEAEEAGVSFGEMMLQFASPVLLLLLALHACIGYVELGTDSWITDIMNNVITGKAALLFIYTSLLMFILRFFAGPIVEKINPVGLLLLSAILGCCGLFWLSVADGMVVILAATVYGIGKTFLWPTMLGVVGERFPKGGALVMGAVGGIGMLSAGLLGGPVIGLLQDHFASDNLKAVSPELFESYASKGKDGAPEKKSFWGLTPETMALDGGKVGAVKEKKAEERDAGEKTVLESVLHGGRMALRWTAAVPATMAVGFGILFVYFAAIGGYKQEHIGSEEKYH